MFDTLHRTRNAARILWDTSWSQQFRPFADREGDSISIPAHDEFERIGIHQWQSGPDRDLTSLGSYLLGMTESAALWASGHTARALVVTAKPDCESWHWFCRHGLGRSWLSDDFRIRDLDRAWRAELSPPSRANRAMPITPATLSLARRRPHPPNSHHARPAHHRRQRRQLIRPRRLRSRSGPGTITGLGSRQKPKSKLSIRAGRHRIARYSGVTVASIFEQRDRRITETGVTGALSAL
jgi:hypothetical protein